MEKIIKKTVRDLFLLLGLITTAYYYRTLHSTISETEYHNKELPTEKGLQETLQKTVILIERLAVGATNSDQQNQLENFYQEVLELQEKYQEISPSLILLGPIGAAATVLKENKMCKELLGLLQEIIKYAEKNESSAVHDCYEILHSLN